MEEWRRNFQSRFCPQHSLQDGAVLICALVARKLKLANWELWSNFDRLDPKMGVFLQSTEATPCGHVLKWKLTPENPPVDTMFMATMAMNMKKKILPWKITEDFQSFVKVTKLSPSLQKSVSCKKMGLMSSNCACLKACFKGYTLCFTTFLVRPSTRAQQSNEWAPKNDQMTLKDQSFVNDLERSKFRQQG